jgi:hypothetical protein
MRRSHFFFAALFSPAAESALTCVLFHVVDDFISLSALAALSPFLPSSLSHPLPLNLFFPCCRVRTAKTFFSFLSSPPCGGWHHLPGCFGCSLFISPSLSYSPSPSPYPSPSPSPSPCPSSSPLSLSLSLSLRAPPSLPPPFRCPTHQPKASGPDVRFAISFHFESSTFGESMLLGSRVAPGALRV